MPKKITTTIKDEATETALRKVIQARSNLVMDEPFFGTLALRLDLTPDPTCKSFWTDGKRMGFNPAYANSQTLDKVIGLVCEEVMHNADGHPWRRDGRDHKEWNISCDFALMSIILAAGMQIPDDSCYDPRFDGMSAEQVYAIRQQERQPQGQDGNGKGGGQSESQDGDQEEKSKQPEQNEGDEEEEPQESSGGDEDGQGKEEEESSKPMSGGEVRDCTEEDAATQEAEWQVAVIQAAQAAKAQGKLPAGIERLMEEIRRPKIDWRAALRRFVQTCARADFTWRQPNRRYVASGLYLPSLRSEQMPPVVIGWDASGSRNYDEAREECGAESAAVIEEVKPERTYVVSFDAKVQRVEEFEPGDEIKFNPKGGGGTDFRPLFAWIEENEIEPACVIMITDGWGDFPTTEPNYPVIWAMTTDVKAPFGETLRLAEN